MIIIGTIDTRQSNSYVDLVIAKINTTLFLDNEGHASKLNFSAIREPPPKVKVTASTRRLRAFGGNLIPVASSISVTVDYRVHTLDDVRFYIVDNSVFP